MNAELIYRQCVFKDYCYFWEFKIIIFVYDSFVYKVYKGNHKSHRVTAVRCILLSHILAEKQFLPFSFWYVAALPDFILSYKSGIFTWWFCVLVWNMWIDDPNQHRSIDPLGGTQEFLRTAVVITCFLSPLLGVWAMCRTYGLSSKSKVLWVYNSIHRDTNFRCFFLHFLFPAPKFSSFYRKG